MDEAAPCADSRLANGRSADTVKTAYSERTFFGLRGYELAGLIDAVVAGRAFLEWQSRIAQSELPAMIIDRRVGTFGRDPRCWPG